MRFPFVPETRLKRPSCPIVIRDCNSRLSFARGNARRMPSAADAFHALAAHATGVGDAARHERNLVTAQAPAAHLQLLAAGVQCSGNRLITLRDPQLAHGEPPGTCDAR